MAGRTQPATPRQRRAIGLACLGYLVILLVATLLVGIITRSFQDAIVVWFSAAILALLIGAGGLVVAAIRGELGRQTER